MEKQSNYRFLYESDAIGQIRVKNINAVELSVNSILDYCLSETGFTYEVDGNLILIKEAREQTLPQKVEKIEGVVKDTQGVPLPGVTVMIDGTRSVSRRMRMVNLRLPTCVRKILFVFYLYRYEVTDCTL